MRNFHIPFQAMASRCEVVLVADDEAQARTLAEPAIAEVLRIEAKYSRYRSDSVVSRINAAAGGEPVLCDTETAQLLAYADQLHRLSGGLFDITAGVLRRAWNFSQPRVPDAATLAPLLALIGWPRVLLKDLVVSLPQAGMELDFGGFGKEYAADRAAALLQQQGLQHGYVNLGGDMRFIGPKPGGEPWMIGIQDPRRADQLVATLPMFVGGLATSGDYERYFELGGQRYCHILDPRSGMPVTQWRTVSVMAPLAVVAGNCSTIAMLAQGQGLDFLQASGLKFLAVDCQGEIHTQQKLAA